MIKSVITSIGIIEYEFKHSKSRRMTIKVKNDGSVVVLSPASIPIYQVEDFIKSRAKWILSHVSQNKINYEKLQTAVLDKIYILGEGYEICFENTTNIGYSFVGSKVILYGDRDKAKKKKKKDICLKAKEYLTNRFYFIKEELGINEDIKLEIRNVKSVWGSFNLSKKLMKLATRLIVRDKNTIDSVIYHEFAHLKVQNHQKQFYKLLLLYCPNYYEWQKGLKNSNFVLMDKFILGK